MKGTRPARASCFRLQVQKTKGFGGLTPIAKLSHSFYLCFDCNVPQTPDQLLNLHLKAERPPAGRRVGPGSCVAPRRPHVSRAHPLGFEVGTSDGRRTRVSDERARLGSLWRQLEAQTRAYDVEFEVWGCFSRQDGPRFHRKPSGTACLNNRFSDPAHFAARFLQRLGLPLISNLRRHC